MRFLQRDLTKLKLYKPTFIPDGDGDGVNVYNEPHFSELYGNIQPFSEKNSPEAYGIDLKYAYVVYTPYDVGFKELDRIFDGAMWYEVKAIQRWHTYYRLMVEQVILNE